MILALRTLTAPIPLRLSQNLGSIVVLQTMVASASSRVSPLSDEPHAYHALGIEPSGARQCCRVSEQREVGRNVSTGVARIGATKPVLGGPQFALNLSAL